MGVQLKCRASFDAHLRRGEGVAPGQLVQLKYNQNHDPENGQFTFAGQGLNYRNGGAAQISDSRGAPAAERHRPEKNRPAPSGRHSAITSGAGAKSYSEAVTIARQIAKEESARTKRITDNFRLGGHNDIYDAERHARWVYRMSLAVGSGWAGVFATGHEFQEIFGQPTIEMQMDLNNNSLGMNAAIEGTGIPTRSTPGLTFRRGNKLVRRGF